MVAVASSESVVPASELHCPMRCIRQLAFTLRRKTLDNGSVNEVVAFAKAKKGYCARLCCTWTSNKGGLLGVEHLTQQRIDQENAYN